MLVICSIMHVAVHYNLRQAYVLLPFLLSHRPNFIVCIHAAFLVYNDKISVLIRCKIAFQHL